MTNSVSHSDDVSHIDVPLDLGEVPAPCAPPYSLQDNNPPPKYEECRTTPVGPSGTPVDVEQGEYRELDTSHNGPITTVTSTCGVNEAFCDDWQLPPIDSQDSLGADVRRQQTEMHHTGFTYPAEPPPVYSS